jgi:hypothetical protein
LRYLLNIALMLAVFFGSIFFINKLVIPKQKSSPVVCSAFKVGERIELEATVKKIKAMDVRVGVAKAEGDGSDISVLTVYAGSESQIDCEITIENGWIKKLQQPEKTQ